MSIGQEFWDTFRKLSALEARTEDVVRVVERLQVKVDALLDRLAKVETQYESLRVNVRNEILADLKAEIAVLKFALGRPPAEPAPLHADLGLTEPVAALRD